jgi:hypothetical protein
MLRFEDCSKNQILWLVYLTLISKKKSSAVASKLSKILESRNFTTVLKRVAKVRD